MNKQAQLARRIAFGGGVQGITTGGVAGLAGGLLSGATHLALKKEARKKWLKTMLLHALGGTTLGATAGGIYGGVKGYNAGIDLEKKINPIMDLSARLTRTTREDVYKQCIQGSPDLSYPKLLLKGFTSSFNPKTNILFNEPKLKLEK